MKTKTYRFINFHLSNWLIGVAIALVSSLFVFFVAEIPIWIIPCLLVLGGFLVLFLNYSSITIKDGFKSSKIVVKNNSKSILLETPVKADVWWNYTFNPNIFSYFEEMIPKSVKPDEINVMLEITDGNGQKVTFVERIVFDFRFPNEAEYSIETKDEFAPQFKVQRVDKLIEFLKGHFVDDEKIKIQNYPSQKLIH